MVKCIKHPFWNHRVDTSLNMPWWCVRRCILSVEMIQDYKMYFLDMWWTFKGLPYIWQVSLVQLKRDLVISIEHRLSNCLCSIQNPVESAMINMLQKGNLHSIFVFWCCIQIDLRIWLRSGLIGWLCHAQCGSSFRLRIALCRHWQRSLILIFLEEKNTHQFFYWKFIGI